VVAAIVSNLCLNWFFTAPVRRWTIADGENVIALGVFVVVAVAVATVVDIAARRTTQAYRARAEASTLAALSRSVLSGDDTAQAIVRRLAQTFVMADVRLEERADDRSPWTTVAHERRAAETGSAEGGAQVAGAHEGGAVTEVVIDDRHRLVLGGRVLPASDRQVVEAFGAQAGIVLEHRRLREQAAQAEVLERTESTRTALLAAVSHDLRTPLAVIRTAVDGLGSPDVELDREDRDVLTATIADSTYRLERLIGNLLDLSRLQTGAVRPALRAASLEEVVPIAVEPWLSDLVLDVPEDLPLVHTDPGLFERVVANVVSNAVRHSPPGTKVLFTASAARDSVELRVADAGPGVPDDRKATMFEPFQRLDDTSTGGLGLGLAVASGLADAVGARIAAEDTPGGGLTMVLTVPREPSPDAESHTEPDARQDDGMVP
jgi:two-component system sensor histidine kinase KdpD